MSSVAHSEGLPHFLLPRPLQSKDARPEEFWPRPAIHRSFECFQAVDVPFHFAVAPRLGNGIPHCVDVSLQRASGKLYRLQARPLGVIQPDAELANALALEHASKSHGESTQCSELRPVLFHRIDFCSLVGRQQSTRLDAERQGHNRRDRTSSRGIKGANAPASG
jgi:hypothetical protein